MCQNGDGDNDDDDVNDDDDDDDDGDDDDGDDDDDDGDDDDDDDDVADDGYDDDDDDDFKFQARWITFHFVKFCSIFLNPGRPSKSHVWEIYVQKSWNMVIHFNWVVFGFQEILLCVWHDQSKPNVQP